MIPPLARIVLPLALLLAACSPKYDWRELPAAGDAIRVTYPARPAEEVRDLQVEGMPLRMTMKAAEVDRAMFAVMHADLPPEAVATDDARDRTMAAFEAVLQKNLRGEVVDRQPVALRQLPSDTRALSHAVELTVRGEVGGQPSWLLARVYLLDRRVIEVVAIGPNDRLPEAAARDFVQSVRAD